MQIAKCRSRNCQIMKGVKSSIAGLVSNQLLKGRAIKDILLVLIKYQLSGKVTGFEDKRILRKWVIYRPKYMKIVNLTHFAELFECLRKLIFEGTRSWIDISKGFKY